MQTYTQSVTPHRNMFSLCCSICRAISYQLLIDVLGCGSGKSTLLLGPLGPEPSSHSPF